MTIFEAWKELKLTNRFRKNTFLLPYSRTRDFSYSKKIQTKEQKIKQNNLLTLTYIITSFFALLILTILTFNIPKNIINYISQKQITSSFFGAICLLGIIAGMFPSTCSKITHFNLKKQSSYNVNQFEEKIKEFKGHHPTCEDFSSHIIKFTNKSYCAGCTGLAIGAIISFIGTLFYLSTDFHNEEAKIFLYWIGVIGVTFGLFQYKSFKKSNKIHFLLNVIFVVGTFFLLIGVIDLNGNFILEFYFLILIVYLIITRITISKLEHEKTCMTCDLKKCDFSNYKYDHENF